MPPVAPRMLEGRQILAVWHEVFPHARFTVQAAADHLVIVAHVWVKNAPNGVPAFPANCLTWRATANVDQDGHTTYSLDSIQTGEDQRTGSPITSPRPEATRRSRGINGAIGWASFARTRWIGDVEKVEDFRAWITDGNFDHGYVKLPIAATFLHRYGWPPHTLEGASFVKTITPYYASLDLPGGCLDVLLMRPGNPADPIALIKEPHGYPPTEILAASREIEEALIHHLPVTIEPPSTVSNLLD